MEAENFVQGSVEWLQSRCGKVTASRLADVMAKTRNGYGASRANYLAQLVAERLTGTPADSFTNAAMQWGIETEPQARREYEFTSNVEVVEAGFILHPAIPYAGASPDGLISDDGMVEIKCPNTATHIDTLISRNVPDKYIKQMMWQMACTGRQWNDFVSFDPRMPANLQLFVKRVPRDNKLITEMEFEVIKFLADVDKTIKQLQEVATA